MPKNGQKIDEIMGKTNKKPAKNKQKTHENSQNNSGFVIKPSSNMGII
jgi:hypothetical protein